MKTAIALLLAFALLFGCASQENAGGGQTAPVNSPITSPNITPQGSGGGGTQAGGSNGAGAPGQGSSNASGAAGQNGSGVQPNAPPLSNASQTDAISAVLGYIRNYSSTASNVTQFFAEIFSKKLAREYWVKYAGTVESYGITTTGTHFVAVKQGNFKYELVGSVGGVGTHALALVIGSDVYSCVWVAGLPQCVKATSAQADELRGQANSVMDEIESQPYLYAMILAPQKEIAGETAHCFATNATVEGRQYEVYSCYTLDGIPLYLNVTGKNLQAEYTATEFSRSVSDSEFVVPAPARDISNYTQAAGAAVQNISSGQTPLEKCLIGCGYIRTPVAKSACEQGCREAYS